MTPIPCVWTGRAYEPINARFVRMANDQHGEGEVVNLAPVEDRSAASHRHLFAAIREAWMNLPEDLADEYPSEEHLRKRALIRAGFCTVQDYPCATRAEAQRWAKNLRGDDQYAVVIVRDDVVRVMKAHSQALTKMDKATFQQSKDAIFDALAQMIGVRTSELHEAANDSHAPGKAA